MNIIGIELHDPGVQTALITGVFGFASGLCTLVCRYHLSARRRAEEKTRVATQDIAFLLAVERIYGEYLTQHGFPAGKTHMRALAREEGHVWSGKFTPGRVAYRDTHNGLGVQLRRMRAILESMPKAEER
jgi:hypothetical protein